MAQDKISLPSGIGGLVSYKEEYKTKLKFKPGHVIIIIIVIIILEILLLVYGKGLL